MDQINLLPTFDIALTDGANYGSVVVDCDVASLPGISTTQVANDVLNALSSYVGITASGSQRLTGKRPLPAEETTNATN